MLHDRKFHELYVVAESAFEQCVAHVVRGGRRKTDAPNAGCCFRRLDAPLATLNGKGMGWAYNAELAAAARYGGGNRQDGARRRRPFQLNSRPLPIDDDRPRGLHELLTIPVITLDENRDRYH